MMLEKNPIKRFLKVLGPGLVTGASDDDLRALGRMLCRSFSGFHDALDRSVHLALMASVQLTCARIGMVSGMGLARCCDGTMQETCSTSLSVDWS